MIAAFAMLTVSSLLAGACGALWLEVADLEDR